MGFYTESDYVKVLVLESSKAISRSGLGVFYRKTLLPELNSPVLNLVLKFQFLKLVINHPGNF